MVVDAVFGQPFSTTHSHVQGKKQRKLAEAEAAAEVHSPLFSQLTRHWRPPEQGTTTGSRRGNTSAYGHKQSAVLVVAELNQFGLDLAVGEQCDQSDTCVSRALGCRCRPAGAVTNRAPLTRWTWPSDARIAHPPCLREPADQVSVHQSHPTESRARRWQHQHWRIPPGPRRESA